MTLQQICSWGAAHNYRAVGDRMVGIYNGYPFSLTVKNGGSRDTLTFSFSLNKNAPMKAIREIRKNLPKGSTASTASDGTFTIAVKSTGDEDLNSLVAGTLETVSSVLSSQSKPVTGSGTCAVCNKIGYDGYALVAGKFTSVHKTCAEERSQKDAVKAAKNRSGGNYALGLLGAVLGAIIGYLPNLLLMYFAEYELGILYMLIPLASYFGYKLCRGKLGGVARLIVILSSLVVFILSWPTIYHFYSLAAGYTDSWLFDIRWFYTVEFTPLDLVEIMWFGTLFLLVGIVVSFRQLGTTNADVIESAAESLESITNQDGTKFETTYTSPRTQYPDLEI